MAVAAYVHGNEDVAVTHYDEASRLIAASSLSPRMFFPLKAANLITAGQIGHAAAAIEGGALLYEAYHKVEGTIFDMYRADVLCAIGDMFARLERMDQAEEVYLNALEQAGVNPNSRPRVEDLAVIVQSLIQCNVPLTPAMQGAVEQLIAGLGEPW
jgi:hypothetical protein